jgi:tRNA(Ile2) C34 agmatinyltransferase TiaS
MYVYYGTNAYNFEKLENPPAHEPTHCGRCGRVIALGEDAYSEGPNGYRCEGCFEE